MKPELKFFLKEHSKHHIMYVGLCMYVYARARACVRMYVCTYVCIFKVLRRVNIQVIGAQNE